MLERQWRVTVLFWAEVAPQEFYNFESVKEDAMLLPCPHFQPSPETRVSRFHVAKLRRDLSRQFSAQNFSSGHDRDFSGVMIEDASL